MSGIYYRVPTLIAIAICLLIVRAGAIALMMTGMSFDKARFQALTAFSGTGFTTREAEWMAANMEDDFLVIYGKLGDLAEHVG